MAIVRLADRTRANNPFPAGSTAPLPSRKRSWNDIVFVHFALSGSLALRAKSTCGQCSKEFQGLFLPVRSAFNSACAQRNTRTTTGILSMEPSPAFSVRFEVPFSDRVAATIWLRIPLGPNPRPRQLPTTAASKLRKSRGVQGLFPQNPLETENLESFHTGG